MINTYLSNPEYSNFIALSRYARWLNVEGRRETWEETVQRYVDFWMDRKQISDIESIKIFNTIHDFKAMGSMRSLMTAGKALDRDNVAGYNCAYTAIDNQLVFDEIMYVLMCGTGIGFSCERQEISKLPEIPNKLFNSDTVINVGDSKIGWATAFRELISLLYSGKIPKWDVSMVRPAGAILKTFGGRASGPLPLIALFNYAISLFKTAVGRKLNSIEVHGLICKIAEIVVVGGVRRSALISLSNLTDTRMANAKTGQWWIDNPEYGISNNSVAYTEKPEIERFTKEWLTLMESKCGERGIFNRIACDIQASKNNRRKPYNRFGTNPCVAPETLLLTIDGYKCIKECVGTTTIWNGTEWSDATVEKTSNYSQLIIVVTTLAILECTENHIWYIVDSDGNQIKKTTKELLVGDKLIERSYPTIDDVFDSEALSGYNGVYITEVIYNNRYDETYCLNEPKRHMAVFNGIITGQCSEIILRSKQFCNLSEVVVRYDDTIESLLDKVEVATIMGSLQATLTNFRYLNDEWKNNTVEESLLGVSLTGIMDCKLLNSHKNNYLSDLLIELKNKAIDVNLKWSKRLGIEQAAAITCVKPSGTVSQLVDSSSGIHPRHSMYYLRTIRADKKDPLAKMMRFAGFPVEDEVNKPDQTDVFMFPMKSNDNSVFRNDRTAIEQLELWLIYQRHWCEHKPSITVYVKDYEWLEVAAWVYKNFDEMSGVAFFPYSDPALPQLPYQEINENEYLSLIDRMPKNVDWSMLSKWETEDRTVGSKTYACSGGSCELVDLI